MSKMLRVKMRWTGFNGSPGYSNFYFRDFSGAGEPTFDATSAAAAVARVDTFAGAIKSNLTNNLMLQVLGDTEVVEDTTGDLVDIINVTQPSPNTSLAAAAPYSAASGAVINWRTSLVRRGRRIRGRTFLVPLAGGAFENNGSLNPGTLTSLQAAAAGLTNQAGSPDLGVWARPSGPGATDGLWALVTGTNVPDMAAVLRSRRD